MKTYFIIIALLCTTYTHATEVQRSQQKASWFCCFASSVPKKPSPQLLQKLGKYEAMVHWESKKSLIRKEVLRGVHPDDLRYGERFPLYDAIVNHDQKFTTFLLRHGADPNQISRHGKPLIFHAHRQFGILLKNGADPLVRDPESQKTLLHACIKINPRLIQKLHEAGIDPCAVDIYNQTALHSALKLLPVHDEIVPPRVEEVAYLVCVGTPFDNTPSAGNFKNMSINQILEQAYQQYPSKIHPYITAIIESAQKRKNAICKGIDSLLTKDPLSIVFAYDGQTTINLDKLASFTA
jgi:hypothetical protein